MRETEPFGFRNSDLEPAGATCRLAFERGPSRACNESKSIEGDATVSDRLSFDEACQELGVSASELEALVAAGEIAATKDGDSLYFSREAIDLYRTDSGEPSILLTDDEVDLLEEDEIDFGIDLEEPASTSAEPETEKLGAADLSTEEISVDAGDTIDDLLDEEVTTTVEETALFEEEVSLGDDDTLLDTDVLSLDEDETDTFDLDTADETLLDLEEEGTLLRSGGARVMQMKRKKSGTGMTVVLAVTALLLLLPMSVLVSLAYLEGPALGAVAQKNEGHDWIRSSRGLVEGPVLQLANLFR